MANVFFDYWVVSYGIPSYLLTDRGPQFVSKFSVAICTYQGAKYLSTTTYHLPKNGQVDCCDKTVACSSTRARKTLYWATLSYKQGKVINIYPSTHIRTEPMQKTTTQGKIPYSAWYITLVLGETFGTLLGGTTTEQKKIL